MLNKQLHFIEKDNIIDVHVQFDSIVINGR